MISRIASKVSQRSTQHQVRLVERHAEIHRQRIEHRNRDDSGPHGLEKRQQRDQYAALENGRMHYVKSPVLSVNDTR
ncbi:MAG: hypothetical protein IPF50_11545 [Proteobacteria bacterium]|nr:hypothetical protein [Pseudomonadota bacterium]